MNKLLGGLVAAASLSACRGATSCVARGSRVTTPRGLVPIEDLAVGDTVVAVDPATGATAVSRIVSIQGSTRECGLLELRGQRLLLTSDHPVFDPEAQGFFPAGDWLLGRREALLRLDDDGVVRRALADHVTAFARVEQVFDLSIDHPWHTFVAEGVVVHNKQPEPCTIPDGGETSLVEPEEIRPACTCATGEAGRWTCLESGGTAVCALCGSVDGGP